MSTARDDLLLVFRNKPPEDFAEWLVAGVMLAFFLSCLITVEGVLG